MGVATWDTLLLRPGGRLALLEGERHVLIAAHCLKVGDDSEHAAGGCLVIPPRPSTQRYVRGVPRRFSDGSSAFVLLNVDPLAYAGPVTSVILVLQVGDMLHAHAMAVPWICFKLCWLSRSMANH